MNVFKRTVLFHPLLPVAGVVVSTGRAPTIRRMISVSSNRTFTPERVERVERELTVKGVSL